MERKIEEQFEEYCDGCPYCDIYIDSTRMYAGGSVVEIKHVATCKHSALCKSLREWHGVEDEENT